MFRIDLLKGQGIPLKTRPAVLAITAGAVAVPFIVMLLMVWSYFYNRITIPIREHEVAACEKKMQSFSEAVKAQQTFCKERDSINASAPEAAVAVRRFTVWSPIIQTIAETIPGAMVLSSFEASQGMAKSQQGGKSVAREIKMGVSGSAKATWDEEVKAFRGRLLESNTLKARLQDIPVAQQSSSRGDKDTVVYDLQMIFKEGM